MNQKHSKCICPTYTPDTQFPRKQFKQQATFGKKKKNWRRKPASTVQKAIWNGKPKKDMHALQQPGNNTRIQEMVHDFPNIRENRIAVCEIIYPLK